MLEKIQSHLDQIESYIQDAQSILGATNIDELATVL